MKALKNPDGSWDWTIIVFIVAMVIVGATLEWCFIGMLLAGRS